MTPLCKCCGQSLPILVRPMHWDVALVYITVTGGVNARCPECKCNMKRLKVKTGHFYQCPKCNKNWELQTS